MVADCTTSYVMIIPAKSIEYVHESIFTPTSLEPFAKTRDIARIIPRFTYAIHMSHARHDTV